MYRPLPSSSELRNSNSPSLKVQISRSPSSHVPIFNYHIALALDHRHANCLASFFLGQLIAPVALDEICAVCSHSRDEPLSSKKSSPILIFSFNLHHLKCALDHSRSAPRDCIFPFQPEFHVQNSEHQQGGHGII